MFDPVRATHLAESRAIAGKERTLGKLHAVVARVRVCDNLALPHLSGFQACLPRRGAEHCLSQFEPSPSIPLPLLNQYFCNQDLTE